MNDKTAANPDVTGGEPASFSLEEWAASKPEAFDRFDEYNKEIRPLVQALRDRCKEIEMPFFVVVVHTQRANGDSATANLHHVPSLVTATPELLMAISGASRDAQAVDHIVFASLKRDEFNTVTKH